MLEILKIQFTIMTSSIDNSISGRFEGGGMGAPRLEPRFGNCALLLRNENRCRSFCTLKLTCFRDFLKVNLFVLKMDRLLLDMKSCFGRQQRLSIKFYSLIPAFIQLCSNFFKTFTLIKFSNLHDKIEPNRTMEQKYDRLFASVPRVRDSKSMFPFLGHP